MSTTKEGRPRPSCRAPRPFRLRNACNECHAAKLKCSGERDGCARCTKQSLQCVYSISKTGKVPGKRARNHSKDIAIRSSGPESGAGISPPHASMHSSVEAELHTAAQTGWSPSWNHDLDVVNLAAHGPDAMEAISWTPGSSGGETRSSISTFLCDGLYGTASPLTMSAMDAAAQNFLPTPPLSESYSSSSSSVKRPFQPFERHPSLAQHTGMERSSSMHCTPSQQHPIEHGAAMMRSHSQQGLFHPSTATYEQVPHPSRGTTPFQITANNTPMNTPMPPSPFSAGEQEVGLEDGPPMETDELRCVQGCCQIIDSIQTSLITQLKVFDLIVALISKTLSALDLLFTFHPGRSVEVSAQCMHLLYACAHQIIGLAALGRDALQEESASSSMYKDSDMALANFNFGDFSLNPADKRRWKARQAVEKLEDIHRQTLAILKRVQLRNGNPMLQSTNKVFMQHLEANFKILLHEYQQIAEA